MKLTRAEFALAIKCHRERLNLSQAELAKVLQVSARTLWGWENERQCATWIEQIGVVEILRQRRSANLAP